MKVVLLLAVFAVAAVFGASSNQNPCDQSGALDSTSFNRLITNLKAQFSIIQAYDYLQDYAANMTAGFSAQQAVVLGTQVFNGNSIYMVDVYTTMSVHMLGMKCADVATIMATVSNELQRLDILPAIVNLTTDINPTNAAPILALFQNTFNKQDAQKIISATTPLSCVFGPITAKRLVFVIDVSGSMGTTFVNPSDGKSYTRLQYVQRDLANIITNVLQPYQQFNVESFSDYAYSWQNTIQAVNPTNVAAAVTYVNKMTPQAGTNTYGAMKLAISDPNVQSIFLLSDGQPNSGQQSYIVSLAQQWAQGGAGRSVNTVCFQVGGTYDPAAISFMQQVAQVSGGTFRSIV